MKKIIIIYAVLFVSTKCFSQVGNSPLDTIFMNNDKIICNVKEVTEDAVKYIYPGEETVNTVYKNAIQKIVFRSGRVSKFAESTSYKKVTSIDDYDNVSFSHVESEVKGLFKLDEVSAKARGTTVFADMERVKERAMYKLKVQAAMQGANVIYLTQEATSGNHYSYWGSSPTATNMAGIAYSNVLPNFNDFKTKLNNRSNFTIVEEDELPNSSFDYTKTTKSEKISITDVHDENGLIIVSATIDGNASDKFRVTSFTDGFFILLSSDENSMFNFKVNF